VTYLCLLYRNPDDSRDGSHGELLHGLPGLLLRPVLLAASLFTLALFTFTVQPRGAVTIQPRRTIVYIQIRNIIVRIHLPATQSEYTNRESTLDPRGKITSRSQPPSPPLLARRPVPPHDLEAHLRTALHLLDHPPPPRPTLLLMGAARALEQRMKEAPAQPSDPRGGERTPPIEPPREASGERRGALACGLGPLASPPPLDHS
jgi:hypothetical protein